MSTETFIDPVEALRQAMEAALGLTVHYWDAEAVLARLPS